RQRQPLATARSRAPTVPRRSDPWRVPAAATGADPAKRARTLARCRCTARGATTALLEFGVWSLEFSWNQSYRSDDIHFLDEPAFADQSLNLRQRGLVGVFRHGRLQQHQLEVPHHA